MPGHVKLSDLADLSTKKILKTRGVPLPLLLAWILLHMSMMKKPMLNGFMIGFFVVGVILFFPEGKVKVQQPIQFNHKKHIDNGLTCEDCHVGVKKEIRATIPNISICEDCHSEALGNSPEEKKVVKAIQEGKDIPWTQVHRLRDDLFFSHRRHVVIAELPCSTCHGEVEARTKPFTKPYRRFKMGFCLKCHYQHGMPRDCSACHR